MYAKIFKPKRKTSDRRLGDQCRDAEDWIGAADAYSRHLTQHDEDHAIWVQLGHAFKEQGRLDEAAKAYQRAFDLDSDGNDAIVHLTDILRRLAPPESISGNAMVYLSEPGEDGLLTEQATAGHFRENRILLKLVDEAYLNLRRETVNHKISKKRDEKYSSSCETSVIPVNNRPYIRTIYDMDKKSQKEYLLQTISQVQSDRFLYFTKMEQN